MSSANYCPSQGLGLHQNLMNEPPAIPVQWIHLVNQTLKPASDLWALFVTGLAQWSQMPSYFPKRRLRLRNKSSMTARDSTGHVRYLFRFPGRSLPTRKKDRATSNGDNKIVGDLRADPDSRTHALGCSMEAPCSGSTIRRLVWQN